MIPDSFQVILNKLNRIDPAAAEYVKKRYVENTIWSDGKIDYPYVVGHLFSWRSTPQGWDYWYHIHNKYITLPKTTKLGNEF